MGRGITTIKSPRRPLIANHSEVKTQCWELLIGLSVPASGTKNTIRWRGGQEKRTQIDEDNRRVLDN